MGGLAGFNNLERSPREQSGQYLHQLPGRESRPHEEDVATPAVCGEQSSRATRPPPGSPNRNPNCHSFHLLGRPQHTRVLLLLLLRLVTWWRWMWERRQRGLGLLLGVEGWGGQLSRTKILMWASLT